MPTASQSGIVVYEQQSSVIYHKLWCPAGALKPATTSGCAAVAPLETTTNKRNYDYLSFPAGSITYAYGNIPLPYEYTGGNLFAKMYWTHPSTTTNFKVKWGIQLGMTGDSDNLDYALGTAVYSLDTGGNTYYRYTSPQTTAITPSGTPGAEKLLSILVQRTGTDATNDTLAVGAYFMGLLIYYPVL